jgi:hypothetical protein
MARGVVFTELLDMLRGEAMLSTNPDLSSNILPNMKQILQRTQRQLWLAYDWKFLKGWADKIVSAGQRYYDFPTTMDSARIARVYYRWNNLFMDMEKGISPLDYNAFNSELATPIRADPAMRWDFKDINETQFEIHPIPATNGSAATGYVRFTGIKNLNPLTVDSDRCTLDADLIVLYAAAEILGPRNIEESKRKLELANAFLSTIKGQYQAVGQTIRTLGGRGMDGSRRTPRMAPPLVAVDRGT